MILFSLLLFYPCNNPMKEVFLKENNTEKAVMADWGL